MKNVGIADMKIVRAPGELITYALGSCVGIVLYDPVLKLAALIHIMLPNAMQNPPDNIYKYADSGIYDTLSKLQTFGAVKSRLIAKIAGGAKMFNVTGDSVMGTIGARNIEAVTQILQKERIRIMGNETGGSSARTLVFNAETGVASIRVAGKGEKAF